MGALVRDVCIRVGIIYIRALEKKTYPPVLFSSRKSVTLSRLTERVSTPGRSTSLGTAMCVRVRTVIIFFRPLLVYNLKANTRLQRTMVTLQSRQSLALRGFSRTSGDAEKLSVVHTIAHRLYYNIIYKFLRRHIGTTEKACEHN